jgi:membrane protein implicated in regulation of membrane protease activity
MAFPSAWQLWIAAGVVLCTAEIKVPGFVLLPAGLGALVAALPAALEWPAWAQLAFFSAGSLAAFVASRTVFKRLLVRAPGVATNVDAMLGREAEIVEAIAEGGTGTARIHGELWAARSLTGAMSPGERALIERVDGLKLYLRRPGSPLVRVRKEPSP